MRPVIRVVISSVVMTGSVVAGRAHAQPSDSNAVAEQLFNQARELAKANRWAEACPKFEASLRADPVLGTRLNLATCYEHIGKLASAWGLFRESVELAAKAGDKRRDYAQKQADTLEPRLPRLTISAPERPPAGLVVKRDGAQIDAGALGVALYLDPGAHEITASAPGFEAFTRTATLVEGKAETLAIPKLAPTPVRATDPPTPREAHAAPPESAVATSPTHKYVALGAGVAGMATIGVGLLFGNKASSAYHDAKALCGANLVCSTDTYPRGQQLIRDTRSDATISTVLVVAGGAAVATGVVVFLTGRRPRERATAQIIPVIDDRATGLAVTGRF